ncbi:NAD-P-binding protein [Lactarius akahatsu]|uniref:NAD-P-binding protein n=1 Tax=Lactarius akahatsu TaxID=416441 RepID=A0AAD4LRI9_9AGAM|nr:NAD-P-binding protein [Lactarius akahatsu]
MSGYKNFAVVGAGAIGSFIVRQLLVEKAAGTVNDVVGSKTTVDPAAKLIPVDYLNKESVKKALTGVVRTALGLQPRIAQAAKEVGVKLFVPSEFGGPTKGETEGLFGEKGKIEEQLKAIGIPYALFYTGGFADSLWVPHLDLDVTSGKVSVGSDGSNPMPFTSRLDIARYLSYSLNEIFKEYEAKTGKKLEVTYIPVSELDARLASNPQDIFAFLHKVWATMGRWEKTDNHLYPDWNPSSVVDNLPFA